MTVTAGLDQIAARFGEQAEPGAGVLGEVTAQLVLGRISKHLDYAERKARRMWQTIHTVPIRGGGVTGLANATGLLDQPSRFGPTEGYWWDLGRLSCWGFTAGTVTAYLNDSIGVGEPLAVFTVPGQWTWGQCQASLAPRDRIVFIGTGITGSIFVGGQATEVESWYWPEYVS